MIPSGPITFIFDFILIYFFTCALSCFRSHLMGCQKYLAGFNAPPIVLSPPDQQLTVCWYLMATDYIDPLPVSARVGNSPSATYMRAV